RGKADLRAFGILGATLVGAVAVTAWLALRWRRRAAAAAVTNSIFIEAGSPAASPAPIAREPDEPSPADLNLLLSRLERDLRQRVPRSIAFRLSLLPELWRCRADPQTTQRLVLGLVAAATDDLKGNGELVVG